MAATKFQHTPILLNKVAALLPTNADGIYLDGTLGGGGHAEAILDRLSGKGRLIGIDRDIQAVEATRQRLRQYKDKFTAVNDNFKNFETVLDECNVGLLDGILLDLGVSSHQLDVEERGFSYSRSAPLDMRMDRSQELTAGVVVNSYDERRLTSLIKTYGEERYAKRIAAFIVNQRHKKEIETTAELVDIIKMAIPAPARRKGGHPAKRTFQAIRIEVNGELEGLGETVEAMIKRLKDGGKLCVLTFHSLEDRVVKKTMRKMEAPCTCPKDAPVCTCGKESYGKCVPRKAINPSDQEVDSNPRARSAKLRVFVRKKD